MRESLVAATAGQQTSQNHHQQQQKQQQQQQQRYGPNLWAVELPALLANSETDGNREVGLVVVGLAVVRKLTGILVQYFSWMMKGRGEVRLGGAGPRLTVREPHAKWLRERKVGCVEEI